MASPAQIKADGDPNQGRLVTLARHSRMGETAELDIPWAGMLGRVSEFARHEGDWPAFVARGERMLKTFAGVEKCLWVCPPDVVGWPWKTRILFDEWAPKIKAAGCPVAFSIQDGVTSDGVPWGKIAAIFVGGTDPWRLGSDASLLISEAIHRGKLVHMTRVNSATRARYAASLDVDSIDGSSFTRFRRTMLPLGLAWSRTPRQIRLID